ncbi:hypothetical protein QR680_014211 [Steinernema hermaphroditum]|uniref:Protein kinase domain-containing protein n=1 Tax=Steinernema hermaphroditum TaxID=289476 RepID=A0AA39M2T6_9BILA|nr:hypothetical protein QR680_014211 [Steinernema hermaphroditum]
MALFTRPFQWFFDNDYDLVDYLGSGGFGTVLKITSKEGTFAMKTTKCWEFGDIGRREFHALQRFQCHPNVLKCHAGKMSNDGFRLLLDLAPYGDLRQVVDKHGFCRRHTAHCYYNQIMGALHCMHTSDDYCHRDLKPENVLVFSRQLCKIGDFGSSLPMDFESKKVPRGGTRRYHPPDIISAVNGIKMDQWGAGMILAFCLIGKDPWNAASMDDPEYEAFQRVLQEELLAPCYNMTSRFRGLEATSSSTAPYQDPVWHAGIHFPAQRDVLKGMNNMKIKETENPRGVVVQEPPERTHAGGHYRPIGPPPGMNHQPSPMDGCIYSRRLSDELIHQLMNCDRMELGSRAQHQRVNMTKIVGGPQRSTQLVTLQRHLQEPRPSE